MVVLGHCRYRRRHSGGDAIIKPAVTNKPQSNCLGLAIVREIVKQHEGTVSYTTQWGKGTTFHLKFPMQAG